MPVVFGWTAWDCPLAKVYALRLRALMGRVGENHADAQAPGLRECGAARG